MIQVEIFDGDVLVVDRAPQAGDRDVVIASLDGEFTVQRLKNHTYPALHAENPDYEPIRMDVEVEML